MILSCEQLFNSTQNPRINMITLDLLREYYETFLIPFNYKYEISNEATINDKREFELRFEQENFCHLFGLESIVSKNVRNINLYKGQVGWDNIKKGIITFKDLKSKNQFGFNDNKARFVFFYLLPKLVESPQAVLFDPTKVLSHTKIDCEILFYDEYEKANIHIGIKKDEELGYYIPKTFLIKKINDKSDGLRFIKDQQKITVSKIIKELVKT